MIHYTMNIRQTMLHLSGGLLLLLAPACTSEVDLEGGQPLEVTAEDRFFSVYPCGRRYEL